MQSRCDHRKRRTMDSGAILGALLRVPPERMHLRAPPTGETLRTSAELRRERRKRGQLCDLCRSVAHRMPRSPQSAPLSWPPLLVTLLRGRPLSSSFRGRGLQLPPLRSSARRLLAMRPTKKTAQTHETQGVRRATAGGRHTARGNQREGASGAHQAGFEVARRGVTVRAFAGKAATTCEL